MNLMEMLTQMRSECSKAQPLKDPAADAATLRAWAAALAVTHVFTPGQIVRQKPAVYALRNYHLATPIIVLEVLPADEAERTDHGVEDVFCAMTDADGGMHRMSMLCSTWLEPYPEADIAAYVPTVASEAQPKEGAVTAPASVIEALDYEALEDIAGRLGKREPDRRELLALASKMKSALADLAGPRAGTLQ